MKRKTFDEWDRRTDRVKKPEQGKMRRLYADGWTYEEIAAELDRKPETVRGHVKATQQINNRPVTSKSLSSDVKNLANTLQWLIHVPKPETPFHDTIDLKNEKDITSKYLNSTLNTVISYRTPWWNSNRSVRVQIVLGPEFNALYKRFIELPTSRSFKKHLNEWECQANHYLELVRSVKGKEQISAAYYEANKSGAKAHEALWDAVESIRWVP